MANPYREVQQISGRLTAEVRWHGETEKADRLRRELSLARARHGITAAVDDVLPLTDEERETLVETVRNRH